MRYTAYLPIVLLLTGFLSTCDPAPSTATDPEGPAGHEHHATAPTEDKGATAKKPLSPRTTAMGNIGDVHVHIDYSSPSMRGRTIWGGLVAYDRVWATGAHTATSVNFSEPVLIGDGEIAAGTYALFTIPGREVWTVILNRNYEQHLADDYDEADDVVRLRVTPTVTDTPTEALTYTVEPAENGAGAITIAWDKLRVSLPVRPAA